MSKPETFDAMLDKFVDCINQHRANTGQSYQPVKVIEKPVRRRNIKIADARNSYNIYCSVSRKDGAILKASTERKPAKVIAGNIYVPSTYLDNDLACHDWTFRSLKRR